MKKVVLSCVSIVRPRVSPWFVMFALLASGMCAEPAKNAPEKQAEKARAAHALSSQPVIFEENRGQAPGDVRFLSHGNGYSLALKPGETVVQLHSSRQPGKAPAELRTRLLGAQAKATLTGTAKARTRVNYMMGSDRSRWLRDVPTYASVQYNGVYPGIDLTYYGRNASIEYDFLVNANADPKQIAMELDGARKLVTQPNGDVKLDLGNGEVTLRKPVAYQQYADGRHAVDVEFAVASDTKLGFKLGNYDHSRSLVIDPVITYAAFIGQLSTNITSIGLDAGNQLFFVASTAEGGLGSSTLCRNYDTSGGCSSGVNSAMPYNEAVVGELDINGTLVWVSYIGGTGDSYPQGSTLAVTGSPYLVLGGYSYASDFPTAGAGSISSCATANQANKTGCGFLMELDGSGFLTFSTYIGGSNGSTTVNAASALADGTMVVTGNTSATDFATTPDAFQRVLSGSSDAFVMKWTPNGPGFAVSYSTLFGGKGTDTGTALTTNGTDVWIAGNTTSTDIPTTYSPMHNAYSGFWYGYVQQLSGSAYFGSSSTGMVDSDMRALSVDPTGNRLFASVAGADSLYTSKDGGYSWINVGQQFNQSTPGHIATSAAYISPKVYGPPTYYAAVPGQGVYASTDGMAWTLVNNGIPGPYNLKEATADPFSGQFLIVYGTSTTSLPGVAFYGTTNASGPPTWSAMTFNGVQTSNVDITGLAWDQQVSGLVWAYVQGGNTTPGFYKSTDHGQTWTLSIAGPPAKRVFTGPLDPGTLQSTVFIIDGSDQLEESLGGGPFGVVNVGISAPITAFTYGLINNTPIYFVGSQFGDVWQSNNLGYWIPASNDYYYPTQNFWWRDLAFGPPTLSTYAGDVLGAVSAPQIGFLLHMDAKNQLFWRQTYGGTNDTSITSIAQNAGTNHIYIAGTTLSTDLPSANYSFLSTYGPNGYVSFINEPSNYAERSEYFGAGQSSPAVTVEATGRVLATGNTMAHVPQESNAGPAAIQGYLGGNDGILAEYDTSNNLLYFTYLGGTGNDTLDAITVDGNDNVYLGGSSSSSDFMAGNIPPNNLPPTYTGNGGVLLRMDLQQSTDVDVSGTVSFTNSNVAVGGPLSGGVYLTNAGPSTATVTVQVVFTDTAFTSFGVSGATCNYVYSYETDCTLSMPPNSSTTLPFSGVISPTASGSGYVEAYVNTSQTNRSSFTAPISYFDIYSPVNLSISMTPQPLTVGTQSTFTFTLTNQTPGAVNASATMHFIVDPSVYLFNSGYTITDPVATHYNYCSFNSPNYEAICTVAIDNGSPITVSLLLTPTKAGTFNFQYDLIPSPGADPDMSDNSGSQLLTVGAGPADPGGSLGTEFWVAFPPNGDQQTTTLVLNASSYTQTANGYVLSTDGTINDSVAISSDATYFTIPTNFMLASVGSPENKALHVVTTAPVDLQLNSMSTTGTSEGYLALPVSTLGTDYYVVTMDALPNADSAVGTAQVTIIATQDNTTVNITPTAAAGTLPANQVSTITLNQGQTYYLESAGDLTYTHINSDKAIGVLSGNRCATINLGSTAPTQCNHLVEQLMPTNLWGQTFGSPDAMGRAMGHMLKVVGPPGTSVQNETNFWIIGSNGWVDLPATLIPERLTASAPIEVVAFTEGQTTSDMNGNATMMLVPPMETWTKHHEVGTPYLTNSYYTTIELVGPLGLQAIDSPLQAIGFDGGTYYYPNYFPGSLLVALEDSEYSDTVYQYDTPAPSQSYEFGTAQGNVFAMPGDIGPFATATSSALTLTNVAGQPTPSSVTVATGTCLIATAQLAGTSTNVPISFNMYGPNSGAGNMGVLEQSDLTGTATTNIGPNTCLESTVGATLNLVATSGTNISSPVQVTWVPTADLSSSPSSYSSSVAPGQSMQTYVNINNLGNSFVKGAILTMTVNNGSTLTFDTSSFGESPVSVNCSGPGATVTCTVDMPPGQGATVYMTLTAGSLSGTFTSDFTAPGYTDPNPANNGGSFNYTVSAGDDLSVMYTPPSGTQLPNTPYTYTITIANAGPQNLYYDWNLKETVPPFVAGSLTVTPQTATCSVSGQDITCYNYTLNAGASENIQVTMTPAITGVLYHHASVNDTYYGTSLDPNPSNNMANMAVKVAASPNLSQALAIMDRDKETISFYDPTGVQLRQIQSAAPAPSDIAISSNGRILYVAYAFAPYISVYDLQLGKEIHRIQGIRAQAIGVTPDGQYLVVGALDSDDIVFFGTDDFQQKYDISIDGQAGDKVGVSDIITRGMVFAGNRVYFGAEPIDTPTAAYVISIDLSTLSEPSMISAYMNSDLGFPFNNSLAVEQAGNSLLFAGSPSVKPLYSGSYYASGSLNAGPDCGVTINQTGDYSNQYAFACSGSTLKQISFDSEGSVGQVLNFVTLPWQPADTATIGNNLYVIGRRGQFQVYDVNTLTPVAIANTPTLYRPRMIKSVLLDLVDTPTSAPTLTDVTPASIVDGTPNTITIDGTNFAPSAIVRIGSQEYTPTVLSSTQLSVAIPSGTPIGNNMDVVVTNTQPGATALGSAVLAGAFTIQPPAGYTTSDHLLTSSLGTASITDYSTARIGDRPTGSETQDFFTFDLNGNAEIYGPSPVEHAIQVTDFVQGTINTTFNLSNGPGQYTGAVKSIDPAGRQTVLYTMSTTTDALSAEVQDALVEIDLEPSSPTYYQVIATIPANTHDVSQIGGMAVTSGGNQVYVSVLGNDGVGKLLVFDTLNKLGGWVYQGQFMNNVQEMALPYMSITPDDQYLLIGDGDRVIINGLNIKGGNAFQPQLIGRTDVYLAYAGKNKPRPATVSTNQAKNVRRSYNGPFPNNSQFFADRWFVDPTNTTLWVMDTSHVPPSVLNMSWQTFYGYAFGNTFYNMNEANGSLLGAGLTLSPDGSKLYAVQQSDDAVAVFDTATSQELVRYATSAYPSGVTTTSALVPTVNLTTQLDQTNLAILAGGQQSLTANINNTGTVDATGVTANFTLAPGTSLTGSGLPCSVSGQTVTCTVGTITAGTSGYATIVVRPSVIGHQTLTAYASGNEADANPADNLSTAYITVTGCAAPAGYNKTWVGGDPANGNAWSIADNWSPTGVPGPTDSVYICSSALTQPMLDINAEINNILIDSIPITGTKPLVHRAAALSAGPSAQLDLISNTLTVDGSFNGTAIGTGIVTMAGLSANSTITGSAPTVFGGGGNFALSGPLTVTNLLEMLNGTLCIGPNTLTVGTLTTQNYATVDMKDPAGIINTTDLNFQATATSDIEAGTINISGVMIASNNSFRATGTNLVVLNGTSAQTVQLGSGDWFQELTVPNPSNLFLGSSVSVVGTSTFSSTTTQLRCPTPSYTFTTTNIVANGLKTTCPIVINNGTASLNNVEFLSTPDGAYNELTVNNSTGTYNFNNIQFDSLLATGNYVSANGAITVNMINSTVPQPTANTVVTGGAVVNWPTNPLPVLSSATFNSATVPGAPVLVAGSNFIASSVVLWDNNVIPTIFISSTQLQGSVPGSMLSSGGHLVAVFTTGPGGGTSGAVTLQLSQGSYDVTAINPIAGIAGGPSFPIQIFGTGFNNGSVALWNGKPRTTTYVSPTELRATINSSDIATVGTAQVSVQGATGYSNAMTFTISKAPTPPSVTDFQPANATAGTSGAQVSVIGSSFTLSSTVMVNGTARPTNYVSQTQLLAQLTASDVANAGSMKITVSDPVIGQSAAASYGIADFMPTIDNAKLSVSKATSASATLTVNPTGGSYNAPVTFSCSGLPSGMSCSFSPATVTPLLNAAKTTVTIGYTKTSANRPGLVPIFAMVSFGCFGILLIGGTRRKTLRIVLLGAALVIGAMLQVGCGGSAGNSLSHGIPPKTGNTTTYYMVHVTATSGSVSHDTPVVVGVTVAQQ